MKTLLMMSAAALMLSVGAASAATWSRDAQFSGYPTYGYGVLRAAPARHPADFYGTEWWNEGRGTATGGPVGMPR